MSAATVNVEQVFVKWTKGAYMVPFVHFRAGTLGTLIVRNFSGTANKTGLDYAK